jgi:hypothetical protein
MYGPVIVCEYTYHGSVSTGYDNILAYKVCRFPA